MYVCIYGEFSCQRMCGVWVRQRRRKGAHEVGICVVWGEGGWVGGRAGGRAGRRGRDADRARFTAALLLYCCFTAALLLLQQALISATWAQK